MIKKRLVFLLLISFFLCVGILRIDVFVANFVALDLIAIKQDDTHLFSKAVPEKLLGVLNTSKRLSSKRLLAEWYCASSRIDECVQIYSQALLMDNNDPLISFRLGNIMMQRSNLEQAILFWSRARSSPYWLHLGTSTPGCTCDDKELSSGMCYLQWASATDPRNSTAYFQLGRRLEQCGLWEEAIQNLTQSLSTNELSTTNRQLALLSRAMASYQGGMELASSISDIEEAISLDPKNPWPQIRLCSIYRSENDFKKALTACNSAIELSPELSYAYYHQGRVWHSLGDFNKALAFYDQALSLDPNFSVAQTWRSKLP